MNDKKSKLYIKVATKSKEPMKIKINECFIYALMFILSRKYHDYLKTESDYQRDYTIMQYHKFRILKIGGLGGTDISNTRYMILDN